MTDITISPLCERLAQYRASDLWTDALPTLQNRLQEHSPRQIRELCERELEANIIGRMWLRYYMTPERAIKEILRRNPTEWDYEDFCYCICVMQHVEAMEVVLTNDKCKDGKESRESKKVKDRPQAPDKQHGVDYPVFTKGLGVTEAHLQALYLRLAQRGWVSTQTSVSDFLRLFNGNANPCEVIWTGQEVTGKDEPKTVGKAALYVLFMTMEHEHIITCKSSKVGPILESHFVSTDGRYLTSISNDTRISRSAQDFINDLIRILHTQVSSEDIRRQLKDEMESRYDRNFSQSQNWRQR